MISRSAGGCDGAAGAQAETRTIRPRDTTARTGAAEPGMGGEYTTPGLLGWLDPRRCLDTECEIVRRKGATMPQRWEAIMAFSRREFVRLLGAGGEPSLRHPDSSATDEKKRLRSNRAVPPRVASAGDDRTGRLAGAARESARAEPQGDRHVEGRPFEAIPGLAIRRSTSPISR